MPHDWHRIVRLGEDPSSPSTWTDWQCANCGSFAQKIAGTTAPSPSQTVYRDFGDTFSASVTPTERSVPMSCEDVTVVRVHGL